VTLVHGPRTGGLPVAISDPVILVRINQLYDPNMTRDALFEATRGVWKVGPRRGSARYALALFRGEVKEVYSIEGWQPAGTATYETRDVTDIRVPGRWEFRGRPADDAVRSKYLGRSVKAYLRSGSRNPIVYVNC
jgi:hypothetical protein